MSAGVRKEEGGRLEHPMSFCGFFWVLYDVKPRGKCNGCLNLFSQHYTTSLTLPHALPAIYPYLPFSPLPCLYLTICYMVWYGGLLDLVGGRHGHDIPSILPVTCCWRLFNCLAPFSHRGRGRLQRMYRPFAFYWLAHGLVRVSR
jgi:hypothetical protein